MARVRFVFFDLYTGYYPDFHHGIASLTGALREDGHDVSLSHVTTERGLEGAARVLADEKNDITGLSFTSNQLKYAARLLRAARFSAKLTIAGGIHCTLARAGVFQDLPALDGICVGEGEVALRELCRRFDKGEDYRTTPSFFFHAGGRVVENPVAPLRDIGDLPLPDYALFDYRKIIAENGRRFTMILSRGCPHDCSYCCNHAVRDIYPNKQRYVRFPSVPHAIRIIRNNLALCPKTERILFTDDTFTQDRGWLRDFCRTYRKEIGLPFLCNARVETVDNDSAEALKSGGCSWVNFGVESGNEWVRKHILNRPHTNGTIERAFGAARRHGIRTFSFNMVGLPFETCAMAQDTVELNRKLRPDYGRCFFFFPYAGTRLFRLCADAGLLAGCNDSVSGYLESASLKEVFMSRGEAGRFFRVLNSYFCARLIASRLKLSSLVERALGRIVLHSGFVGVFLGPLRGRGACFLRIREKIRAFIVKRCR